MTPRALSIRKEDPGVAPTYLKIADELRRSAADNVVNRRWTAAVTDAIRAGMHTADAVLIHRRGFRSNSPAHADVVEHLRREFGAEVERERTTLSRLIARKHQFDYEGRLATEREGIEAARRAEELYVWARGIVERPKA
jgi:uncharacterized protein (UPF0332 family)